MTAAMRLRNIIFRAKRRVGRVVCALTTHKYRAMHDRQLGPYRVGVRVDWCARCGDVKQVFHD